MLDALAAVGLHGDGRLLQLNSYENRVFQVFLEDGRIVVAKFYRPGRWSDAQILEEHAFATALAVAEIPVAAPWRLEAESRDGPVAVRADGGTLAFAEIAEIAEIGETTEADRQIDGDVGDVVGALAIAGGDGPRSVAATHRFAVCTRLGGRACELEDADVLTRIGRYLGRLHGVGRRGRFAHRLRLDVATFGDASRDFLVGNDLVSADVAPRWRSLVDRSLDACRDAFARTSPATLRLHGDCHGGNILWTDDGPAFVDLDDAVTGPAVQDLWMLLAGERHDRQRQMRHVLDGYRDFSDFDTAELALIEPLRTLRMLHHSAWIARRWADPAFPIAFPFFASPAYWAHECSRLAEQIEAMAEPALDLA